MNDHPIYGQSYAGLMDYLKRVGSGQIAKEGINRYTGLMDRAIAGDPQAGQELVAEMMPGGGFLAHLPMPVGMTVFHGSPHKWSKVDLSKVGTGEGAQAYGHGFYAAENRGVAQGYRDKLTGTEKYVEGELLDPYIPSHNLALILDQESGNIDEAADFLQMLSSRGGSESIRDTAKKSLELLESGKRPVIEFRKDAGSLYELDLPDEQIAKMLDWDAPLSEQPENVRKALRQTNNKTIIEAMDTQPVSHNGGDYWSYMGNTYDSRLEALQDYTGENIMRGVNPVAKSPEETSALLNSLGIPGIKYYDAGSRGAKEGTRNFVIFDEDIIKPLKRNNEPLGLLDEVTK